MSNEYKYNDYIINKLKDNQSNDETNPNEIEKMNISWNINILSYLVLLYDKVGD